MKIHSCRSFVAVCCVLAGVSVLVPAALGQGSTPVRIRRLNGEAMETPEYELKRAYPRGRILQWYAMSCQYETREEWVDELDVTFYALIKTRDQREPYVILKGGTTYVNVEKGNHNAVMYIHPSTLKRYGTVERMAVEMRIGGRPVAIESRPSATQRWWEQLAPRDGLILPPSHTPFYYINFDDYEAIKYTSPGQ